MKSLVPKRWLKFRRSMAWPATTLLVVGAVALAFAAQKPSPKAQFRVGKMDAKPIVESSGLAASRSQPGVFWTHNDSGSPAELFAIDGVGKLLATFKVATKNIDWEDIAIVGETLYIADTGNNAKDRREVYVHAVSEPSITRDKPAAKPLTVAITWTLTFPDNKPFDVEALMIHNGKAYVVSKLRDLSNAGLYRFDLDPDRLKQALEPVGTLPIRFPVTAGDISQDGRWLGLATVNGAFLFRIDGDVSSATKVEPKHSTFTSPKMEACAFTSDGLLTTTEDGDMLMFRWKDFGVTEP